MPNRELIIEAGRTAMAILERPVELPGTVLLFSLARHSCSLQADCYWDSLGTASAFVNNAGLYYCIRQTCKTAI